MKITTLFSFGSTLDDDTGTSYCSGTLTGTSGTSWCSLTPKYRDLTCDEPPHCTRRQTRSAGPLPGSPTWLVHVVVDVHVIRLHHHEAFSHQPRRSEKRHKATSVQVWETGHPELQPRGCGLPSGGSCVAVPSVLHPHTPASHHHEGEPTVHHQHTPPPDASSYSRGGAQTGELGGKLTRT